MSDRKLATVETITALYPIEGADAIVRAQVRGWEVVVKLDEFAVGDLCVYIEVDTLVDVNDPRFAFLAPRGVRTDTDGVSGHVLKTAKLRSAYSQGLVLPLGEFPEIPAERRYPGTDITDLLAVKRWDPPMPAQLAGQVNGRRPSWIPATDEERIENTATILQARDLTWVATEKLDGTSTTIYVNAAAEGNNFDPANPQTWPGVWGVCSRNYDLTYNPDQTQWALALEHDLHRKIAGTWPNSRVAIQGETLGEGIQSNPLKIKGQRLALFTILVDGQELPRTQWPAWALELAVPVVEHLAFPPTVADAVAEVDGLRSVYAPGAPAEGVVWRAADGAEVELAESGRTIKLRASFKVISRKYLLKHDR